MQNQGRKEGLTLLEVVVTIFLVSIIGAAILNLFDFTAVYYNKSIDKERSRKEARFATQWIKRDVSCNTCLYNANATSLSLNVPDWGFVKYYLANNTTLIRENGCSSSPQLVSKNLTDFNLTYYDAYNQLNVSPIRLVEVNVASQVGEESYRGYIAAASPLGSDCLWAKTYGTASADSLYSLQQTSDGGFILGGQTPLNNNDFLVIKTDPSGAIEWAKTYGSSGDVERLDSLQEISDGYILGGRTHGFSAQNYDFFIVKINSQGVVQWASRYGGSGIDRLWSLQQTSDGYILGGQTASFIGWDFLVIKTDAGGNLTWAKTYNLTDGSDNLYSLRQTPDGGYILGGGTTGGGTGALLIKTDSQGDVKPANCDSTCWAKKYSGGNYFDKIKSLSQTQDGYILGGYTSYSFNGEDFFLVKTDLQGDVKPADCDSVCWAKTYGSGGSEKLEELQQTQDGGYIGGGRTESTSLGGASYKSNFLVIKTNENGELSAGSCTTSSCWAKSYGGNETDWLYSLNQTSEGSYILGGSTASFGAGSYDFFVIKSDASGNLDCCNDAYQDVTSNVTISNFTTDAAFIITDITNDATFNITDVTASLNVTYNLQNDPSFKTSNFTSNTTLICPQ